MIVFIIWYYKNTIIYLHVTYSSYQKKNYVSKNDYIQTITDYRFFINIHSSIFISATLSDEKLYKIKIVGFFHCSIIKCAIFLSIQKFVHKYILLSTLYI